MLGWVILLHLLMTLAISGLSWMVKRNMVVGAMAFCICFFFPIGGYIFALIYLLKRNSNSKEIEEDLFEEDILIFTERMQRGDVNSIVAMEEILLVSPEDVKRKKMIDILKEDPLQYIEILQLALRDQDTETSHYASSAISEIKRKFELELQKYNVEYHHNKEDINFLGQYVLLLKNYLESNLLDKYSYKRYQYIYLEVLRYLIETVPTKQGYVDLIEGYLVAEDLGKVDQYCKAFIGFLECEEAYMCQLKYFYIIKDNQKFYKVLEQLRESSVGLSSQGLEKIRFWLEETHV